MAVDLIALSKSYQGISVTVQLEDLIQAGKYLFGQQNENKERPGSSLAGFLTSAQVCEILQVTLQTLYRWEKAGIIKPILIGGQKRYDPNDLENLKHKK